jgi:hypothetical protein
VLPDRPLEGTAQEVEDSVREEIARCRMSIHMIGKTYSLVPEGGTKSLFEIQNDVAYERASRERFPRLLWIAPGLQIDDERQRRMVEQFRTHPRATPGADLLETPLENLQTMIAERLEADEEKDKKSAAPAGGTAATMPQVYFLYDQRDATAIGPWADLLFKDFEIIQPVFEGEEAEIRDYHQENLRTCDAVLIFYGAATEAWLRRKLREVQKAAGYGRKKPTPTVGICLIAPRTPEKENFRTHDAIVIPQWDGASADLLQPFVAGVKEGHSQQGDGPAPV